MMPPPAFRSSVKGVYCVIATMRETRRIRVGSLGEIEFPSGTYVYVGSAMAGVEQRIGRHARKHKKKRWHIDHLMERAEYVASAALPCETKSVECAVALALSGCDGAVRTVPGFGCSDCGCGSHLVYFGDTDPEWVAEAVSHRLSMLECVYPRTEGGGAWTLRGRQ